MKKILLFSMIWLAAWANAQHALHVHQHAQHTGEAESSTAEMTADVTTAEATTETSSETSAAVAKADDRCRVAITGNDRMKYNIQSFTVPTACDEFTIDFENIGKLPKTSMGHNVVIAKKSEAQDIAQSGMSAGPANDYLQPDESRIIVRTEMLGGGEKTTLTFKTEVLKADEDYLFFCSFPGHFFTMQGKVIIE